MIKTSSQTILPVISPNRGSIMQNSGSKEKLRFPSMGNSFQMRTLDKYIRSNNVSELLKDSRVTMTPMRDRGDVVADEVKEATLNVLNLRKKCNETRELCVKKEQEITKLRSEIDNMRTKEETISEGLLTAQSKLDRLNIALEHQNVKIEEAFMNKRVYSNMLDRTKRDKLADQMKEAYLENILHKEHRELNAETKQAVKAKQFEFQTRNMFEGVVKHLEHEDRKRQENLDVFEQTVIAQEEAETKRTERFERNQVLAENISNDLQDSNNTRWREVLLVHRFLNHFLRRKIEREIREYENVEKAYQKIKASTGLNDTREIVHRFVNREQTYSELLISIADYEKKIGVLKKHNEQLKSTIQSLKDQNGPSERYKEDKGEFRSDLPQAYKALSLTNSVCKEAKLRVEKTFTWAIQTLVKIDKAKNIMNNDYYKTYSKDNLSQAFLQVIDVVKSNLTDLNENNVEQVLDEIDKTKIDQEIGNETFIAKNVRVKQVDTTSERTKTAESNMPISKLNVDDKQYIGSRTDENALDEFETLEVQRVHIKQKTKGETIRSRKNLDKK